MEELVLSGGGPRVLKQIPAMIPLVAETLTRIKEHR